MLNDSRRSSLSIRIHWSSCFPAFSLLDWDRQWGPQFRGENNLLKRVIGNSTIQPQIGRGWTGSRFEPSLHARETLATGLDGKYGLLFHGIAMNSGRVIKKSSGMQQQRPLLVMFQLRVNRRLLDIGWTQPIRTCFTDLCVLLINGPFFPLFIHPLRDCLSFPPFSPLFDSLFCGSPCPSMTPSTYLERCTWELEDREHLTCASRPVDWVTKEIRSHNHKKSPKDWFPIWYIHLREEDVDIYDIDRGTHFVQTTKCESCEWYE
jgi:hypothetical protein